MAVKGAENAYDCAAKAEEGEPYFTLLARDPIASMLVRLWAHFSEVHEAHPAEKVRDAIGVAEQMERWVAQRTAPVKEDREWRGKMEMALTLVTSSWFDADRRACSACGSRFGEADSPRDPELHADGCGVGIALAVLENRG